MKLWKVLFITAPFLLAVAPVQADDAPAYTGLPYNGEAIALPGIVQAEE